MSEHVVTLTDDTFENEVLNATTPILVDFWADWCGPCKMLAPILEEVAQAYADKVKVMKMNVDENRDTPAKYGVRGIPTLLLFKAGNLEATKVGSMTNAQLSAFLDGHL